MAEATDHYSDKRFKPLGDPPKYFEEKRTDIWNEIKETCPLDLKTPDRFVVEMLTRLIHQSRFQKINSSEMNQMRQYLSELQMTPGSRGETKKPKAADAKSDLPLGRPPTNFGKFKRAPRPR